MAPEQLRLGERQISALCELLYFSQRKNLMAKNVPEAKRQIKTHARCRCGATKRDHPKLIIEENNGSSEFKNDSKTKTVILERMLAAGPVPPRGIAGS